MLVYRTIATLLALAVLVRAAVARDWTALGQRLGGGVGPEGPVLWLHAASNGELASARPVIDALTRARPDLTWLVTCNSSTGVALARGWGLQAQLAPLDLAWVVARVVRRWQPVAHLSMESELWPHRIRQMPGPVIVLGARMSASTARNWARFPALASDVLGRLSLVAPQDDASRDRLRNLGLPEAALAPVLDLKALYRPDTTPPDAALRDAFARHATWAAMSTHPGEEEVVLDAHARALQDDPGLRLILVPRHPRRGDAIADMIARRGLDFARRSTGEAPRGSVYLADTMGETALWYNLAGRVFVGGSLGELGGHTPYEPAAYGAALIHGPDMRNFADPRARLAQTGASIEVSDAETLAAALRALATPQAQQKAGRAASGALSDAGALDDLVTAILAHLPQSH